MLTIDALKGFGADTDSGLTLLAGNEALYLKLVSSVAGNENFDKLSEGVKEKDLDKAFEAAHALKGVLGNLRLSPLTEKVSEVTEHLRSREDIDYGPYVDGIMKLRDDLDAICRD